MHFRADLVVLSILVATLAGHVSLDLTQRALRVPVAGARRRWVLGAALTMGLGIWSMHFLGMLALDLARPVEYQLGLVAVSMVAAVLGAGVALWVITRPDARRPAVFVAAGYMGAAVGAMHYTGIASMQVDAHTTWSVGLVALSVVVAYAASLFALATVFAQRGHRDLWALRRRLAAAVVLGLGVSGLHYLAMYAMHFHATTAMAAHGGDLNTSAIATLLVAATAIMLVILLAGAQLDQRRAATASDLAAVAATMREIGRSDDPRASIGRAVCELTSASMGGLLEPDGHGNLVITGAHGLEDGDHDQPRGALGQRVRVPRSRVPVRLRPRQLPGGRGARAALRRRVRALRARGARRPRRRRAVRGLEAAREAPRGPLGEPRPAAGRRGRVRDRARRPAPPASSASPAPTSSPAWPTAAPPTRSSAASSRAPVAPASRCAVAMIDLDHFKAYNDRHGHAGGDRLLRQAAQAWAETLRAGDLLARYGGEEFVAFFPGCTLDDAEAAAERLRAALPDAITCSIGVALWNRGESAFELLGRADAALYKAKAGGRDRTIVARETTYVA